MSVSELCKAVRKLGCPLSYRQVAESLKHWKQPIALPSPSASSASDTPSQSSDLTSGNPSHDSSDSGSDSGSGSTESSDSSGDGSPPNTSAPHSFGGTRTPLPSLKNKPAGWLLSQGLGVRPGEHACSATGETGLNSQSVATNPNPALPPLTTPFLPSTTGDEGVAAATHQWRQPKAQLAGKSHACTARVLRLPAASGLRVKSAAPPCPATSPPPSFPQLQMMRVWQ